MRLIILNQFFYPDHSATSQLMTDLAESLAARGVEVTVLAGRGRYTGGECLPPRESYRGIKIERAWSTNFGKKNIVARLADYLSFYLEASWRLLRLPRHDVVMALTTPPLIGLVALVVARLRGMRMVALVQDVYPDVAVALGTLSARNPLTRLLNRLSLTLLRGADRIIVLGECMRKRISGKVGEDRRNRIDVIHNWADGEKIAPLRDEANPFIDAHGLKDKFIIAFSGNFGRVNEFETILDAARLLRTRADIKFLFIGDGAKASEIKLYVERHKLENVLLLPYQPRELLRYSLAAGSVHFVTLAEGLAGLSVPSKVYPLLAAGRALIFVGDARSSAVALITEYACGEVVSTGESGRLVQIISDWSLNKTTVSQLGTAARRAFEERFDRPHAVSAYLHSLNKSLGIPSNELQQNTDLSHPYEHIP